MTLETLVQNTHVILQNHTVMCMYKVLPLHHWWGETVAVTSRLGLWWPQ